MKCSECTLTAAQVAEIEAVADRLDTVAVDMLTIEGHDIRRMVHRKLIEEQSARIRRALKGG